MEVKGRDLSAGLPKTLPFARKRFAKPAGAAFKYLESVRITLERCPPELSAIWWIVAWSWRWWRATTRD